MDCSTSAQAAQLADDGCQPEDPLAFALMNERIAELIIAEHHATTLAVYYALLTCTQNGRIARVTKQAVEDRANVSRNTLDAAITFMVDRRYIAIVETWIEDGRAGLTVVFLDYTGTDPRTPGTANAGRQRKPTPPLPPPRERLPESTTTAPGLAATRHHIDLIDQKVIKLQEAKADALDQLEAALGRSSLSPSEMIEWWRWAQSVKASTGRLCAAMGTTPGLLSRWDRSGIPIADQRAFTGTFPVGYQLTPLRGQPCIYALLAETEIVYIGQSRNVAERLRNHWRDRDKRAGGITGWEIVILDDSDDLTATEMASIFQHQPGLNTVGKGRWL